MRQYHLTIILPSDLKDTALEKAVDKLSELLKKSDFKIAKAEKPAKKLLAYEIGKNREGIYLDYKITGEADKVLDLSKKLRLEETILRHLLVAE